MGVRIIEGNKDYDGAVLYCSTSMWAFGPVFENGDAAQEFLDWLKEDPRRLSQRELEMEYHDWLDECQEQQEAEQYELTEEGEAVLKPQIVK